MLFLTTNILIWNFECLRTLLGRGNSAKSYLCIDDHYYEQGMVCSATFAKN